MEALWLVAERRSVGQPLGNGMHFHVSLVEQALDELRSWRQVPANSGSPVAPVLERLLLQAKASRSLDEVSLAVHQALRVVVDSGPLSDFLPSLGSLALAIRNLEARQIEGHTRHISEAELCAAFPIGNRLAGWFFRVREISAGAFLVEGTDRSGRSVSRHGSDPEETLSLCIEDARAISSSAR